VQEPCIERISMRSVDDLVKAMGMIGISRSEVSQNGRIVLVGVTVTVPGTVAVTVAVTVTVTVAVTVAVTVGVNSDGGREVPGTAIGAAEAGTFRMQFLRSLARRGLRGVRRVVPASIATAFAQETPDAAKGQWRKVAGQLRPTVPRLATLMDTAGEDGPAYTSLAPRHRLKLHSTNPIERVDGEIERRTSVVGIFPNEEAITRPVGAILFSNTTTNGPPSARVA
jgi:putative transposase